MTYQGFIALANKLGYIKQNEFAERTGLDTSQVNRHWRADTHSRPTLRILETAADKLDMKLSEVVSVLYGETK